MSSQGELEQESEPGTSGQMTSTEEQLQSLDTEDVSQMTAASEDPADDTLEQEPAEDQSEAEAQAMQPAEPPLPPAPQFLRPTIEIDRSDILHTAKVNASPSGLSLGCLRFLLICQSLMLQFVCGTARRSQIIRKVELSSG